MHKIRPRRSWCSRLTMVFGGGSSPMSIVGLADEPAPQPFLSDRSTSFRCRLRSSPIRAETHIRRWPPILQAMPVWVSETGIAESYNNQFSRQNGCPVSIGTEHAAQGPERIAGEFPSLMYATTRAAAISYFGVDPSNLPRLIISRTDGHISKRVSIFF